MAQVTLAPGGARAGKSRSAQSAAAAATLRDSGLAGLGTRVTPASGNYRHLPTQILTATSPLAEARGRRRARVAPPEFTWSCCHRIVGTSRDGAHLA